MEAEEGNEREGAGQKTSAHCSYDPNTGKMNQRPSAVFSEAVGKLEPGGRGDGEENIFTLKLHRGGGARI